MQVSPSSIPRRISSKGPGTWQLALRDFNKSTSTYLQGVRHREAHQASTKAVPRNDCKQGGKQDNAVSNTLQSHSEPPAGRHKADRCTYRHVHAHTHSQLLRDLAPGHRGEDANALLSVMTPCMFWKKSLLSATRPNHAAWPQGKGSWDSKFTALSSLASPRTNTGFSRSCPRQPRI